MSDFDKEAEREKLREKYGEEEEKRKATEQMSELLLKGATMTNAHCTDCGDPIFRYDGQEFCPTCQKPVAREAADEDAGDDHIEVADPSDDATVQFGADGAADTDGTSAESEPPTDETGSGTTADETGDVTPTDETGAGTTADETGDVTPTDETGSGTTAGQQPSQPRSGDQPTAAGDSAPPERQPVDASSSHQRPDATRDVPSADPGRTRDALASTGQPGESQQPTGDLPPTSPPRRRGADDESVTAELSAAESLLAETVHRFARRAADTDDPRTAREHLAAAREAAEALDAVRF